MTKKLKLLTGKDLFNYFEKDPEIQTRYLLNTIKANKKFENFTGYTLSEVLSEAFTWTNTVEGHKY